MCRRAASLAAKVIEWLESAIPGQAGQATLWNGISSGFPLASLSSKDRSASASEMLSSSIRVNSWPYWDYSADAMAGIVSFFPEMVIRRGAMSSPRLTADRGEKEISEEPEKSAIWLESAKAVPARAKAAPAISTTSIAGLHQVLSGRRDCFDATATPGIIPPHSCIQFRARLQQERLRVTNASAILGDRDGAVEDRAFLWTPGRNARIARRCDEARARMFHTSVRFASTSSCVSDEFPLS